MSAPVVHLVRHGHAGDRSAWHGEDFERPLSPKGWRQARGLLALLDHGRPPRRAVSSSSLRCVQTLEPLAEAHGLRVEIDDRLLEGADPREALVLVEEALAAGGATAACSHGDVIPGVLELLIAEDVPFDGPFTWPKASTWVLEGDDSGHVVRARYLPPPHAAG